MDKVIEIKSGKELVGWIGDRFEEVSQKFAAAEETASKQGERIEKAFKQIELLTGDANRTFIPGLTEKTGRLPFTKEAFLQFGMEAAIRAPLSIERGADGELTAGDGPLAKLHEAHDELKILGAIMGKRSPEELKRTKYFREVYAPAYRVVEGMAKGAFDIQTAGEGLEHVSDDMSGSLVEMVRIARRASSLVGELPMPHGVLTVPSWLTDAQAYGFDENTSDTGGTAIPDGITAGMTSNFQITAKGIGLALTTSRFMDEDALFPWLPFLRRAGVQALVNGEEDAMFNGDTTATHMDADIHAVTGHVAKRWKGWRYVGMLAANTAKTNAGGNPINSDDRFRDTFLTALGRMGKYGVNPGALALFAPGQVNAQLLSVEVFKTMYARGAGATNVSGVIQSPFGWNYVLTEYLRNNLAASGFNTSGTATPETTAALIVHTDSWKKGRVREISVQVLDQTRAKYDQIELVFTMRQGFIASRKMDGTEPHVGAVYNIGL